MSAPSKCQGLTGLSKCQGLTGLIFGHKFKYTLADTVFSSNYCSRCGMPKGGWTPAKP